MSEGNGHATEVHRVGPHILEIEPPDVAHVHYDGDVELEHFKAFDDIISAIPPPIRVYILRDARRGGFITPEARAYAAKKVDVARVAAVVTYGSSFQARTVVAMMNKAVKLINSVNSGAGAVFFDSEQQARAWIAEHRVRSK